MFNQFHSFSKKKVKKHFPTRTGFPKIRIHHFTKNDWLFWGGISSILQARGASVLARACVAVTCMAVAGMVGVLMLSQPV
jgi:hypothetical protein